MSSERINSIAILTAVILGILVTAINAATNQGYLPLKIEWPQYEVQIRVAK